MKKVLLFLILILNITLGKTMDKKVDNTLPTLTKEQLIDSAKTLFKGFYGKKALDNLEASMPHFDLIHLETDGKEVRITLGYKNIFHIVDKPQLYRVTLLLNEKSGSLTKYGKSAQTTPPFFIPTKEYKRVKAKINKSDNYVNVIITQKDNDPKHYHVETYTTGGKGSFLLDKKTLSSSKAYGKSRTLESIKRSELERARWREIK